MTEGATQPEPATTGFAAKCAIAALKKHNVNVALSPLLRRAGLPEYAFDDPRIRISASGQAKFLEFAAEALEDTAFGLRLAEQSNPREAGLLFYAAAAARTLGEALALFARYSRVANESLRVKLVSHPEGILAEMHVLGISRHHARQNLEFGIAAVMKSLREITGRKIRPTRVAFGHVRAADLPEFKRFFGCPVEFGAASDQLVFSNETLALPLITEDPHLLQVLQPFCDEASKVRNTPIGSLRASVENEIQKRLPHGQAREEMVAKAMALSVRTLSRRLRAEGTTFTEVVDQLRRSLALQYLREPGFTLAQIAWLLGYEGATSFTRAFRRWAGCSPSIARKEKRVSPVDIEPSGPQQDLTSV